ncbi:hypothetical protein MSG28_007087 [Choristoneura fumiferana]|uniref:Uncharacterized protein n=1 Tax=Choristoneura fumiferana TaxID=7141 RepID=A0ACC0JMF6_CHOFU|nr:hypothetical protein MSG28_007087 [Choristoneura fumiferana]
MRRGHPGMGGWRNESPRHFRPRGGGVPHYRPPQSYQMDLPSKYGGPRMAGPRLHRGAPHFNIHSGPRHDRYSYRPHINPHRLADRDDRDHNYPPPHLRQKDSDHVSPYKNILTYCESRTSSDHSRVNNMGDVDHRQNFNMAETFSQPPPWANPIENRRTSFDNRPHNRATQYHNNMDGNQIPSFTAHRPPSSDHYGSNIPTAIDNSNSFSRSVDDTVDIVRKRLLNRSESQSNADNPPAEQNPDDRPDVEPTTTTYQNEPQTPPAKKRIQRRRQNVQSNCDKIKNKIVHEIFKMDKDKMHKLMDNPNSSTKFEYAISSLITESQNSYDRHMRSLAEKSLCSSSAEFIQDDNNTIYEDTFLKQMQCILEPQDTVLLEDIKPLVMAELNKVLQLDEFDQRFDMVEEDPNYYQAEEPTNNANYSNEYHYEDFSKISPMSHYPEDDNAYYPEQPASQSSFTSMEAPASPETFHHDPEPQLYERRVKKTFDFDQMSQLKRESTESREQARQSADRERHKLSEERRRCDTPAPIFDSNVEQLSDEEDPFADLDKQYHVAVDPNFIEAELDKQLMSATENNLSETDSINKMQLLDSVKDKPPIVKKEVLLSPEIAPKDIKKEIDSQILSIAKSPLKLSSSLNRVKRNHRIAHTPNISVKNELNHVSNANENNDTSTENLNHEINSDNDQDKNEIKDAQKESKKMENSDTAKSTISSNARKRSIDQKPSHRKEKRKKSETLPVEANKQILNKNIIINVNDCSSKSIEKKCDAAKSIFNLYFPKDECEKELPKDVKNVELSDKGYSDKYVKRKETPKKKEQDPKRSRSLSTSHSNISPKENINSCSETQPKAELKIKLKSIDMFLENPKKISSSHQAHRNSAQPTISTTKKAEEKKPVIISKCKIKRHVATQIILPKTHVKDTQTAFPKISKFCQTEIKKIVVKATQTSPVTFEKSGIKSTDTFERMKEIDLEIQVLLQEKFKLYNSLEAKQSSSNPMQNLGMTVLEVTPITENKDEVENEVVLSEDAIVDEFTSIPVEELEQIALESVAEEPEPSEPPTVQKRSKRQKLANRTRVKSQSPTVVRSNRKTNTPNISLIEQIITDDRPLEDIISLDDLEVPEVKPATSKKKTKSRSQKASKKKTAKKSKTVKPVNPAAIALGIRECFVALKREDLSRYTSTIPVTEQPKKDPGELSVIEETTTKSEVPDMTDVAEETVVTEPDMPFDMLDVSEDIVIGDECEIKSEEKDAAERVDLPINEDVILDNSQSSEDVAPAEVGHSDKECKLFDYSADETLKRDSVTVTGHADAVLAIECVENNFIAACLDGNVYHFNNDGQLLTTLRGSNLAVTCLTIVKEKYGTTVYTGSLDSRIRYYDLKTGLEKGPECNVLSPIQTMDRAWDTVFVGTRTGFVLQFECKNNMLIPVSTVKFSEQSILALRALKEGPRKVLLVAARSENVTIKDAQTGLLLRTLEGPKMTVYTLLYEDGKVYCGTSSHQIHVFDYASGSHWASHSGGKGCVCLRAAGGLLLAGCYDGCVYVYREGEGRPLAMLRGPSLMLLSLAVQGTKIIAGYKDRSLYIWKIPLSILKEMIL